MGVVYAFSFANSERSMTPMRFDDHRKIVGTGFNTDPKDAACKNGRWRLCVRLCLAQATAHVGAACIARAAPAAANGTTSNAETLSRRLCAKATTSCSSHHAWVL